MSILAWFTPPYDLRQAVLAGVLLPLTGLSAIVVLVLVSWAERSLEARLQGEIELISRAVAPGIGASLQAGEYREIRRSLDWLFSIRRVYGAAVYDARGEPVVAAGIADRTLRRSQAATDVVRTGRDDGHYRSVDGRNVYSYFSPLLDHGGRINGLLQITRERREIDSTLRQVRFAAWTYWLGSAGAALIATLVLYRRLVGRHVMLLLSRMRALAEGDRSATIHAPAPREFLQIGSGFNAMVEAIRQAEEELQRRQTNEQELERQLQETERIAVLGRVTQGLAHELASPLTVIDARIRRLERYHDPGRHPQLLQDVRRQAARMTDIVRQLLNYGLTARSTRQPVVLYELLRRVARDMEETSVQMVLVEEGERVEVSGDPVRLELAVSNLLRNAVRHARGRVEAGVTVADAHAILYVSDDGEGVTEADRPQIFEPFFTRQPPGSGTGLGLAIVANVMREHQGIVQHENLPHGGSRFCLLFPWGVEPCP